MRGTRQQEHQLEVKTDLARVWDALTSARELSNWFPLSARVEPGVGGTITYCWEAGLKGVCPIEVWEPPSGLRMKWPPGPGAESRETTVDWRLEGKEGVTSLQLVHSGFGTGEEWDREYDGIQRGWSFELRSLKHYLDVHPGEARMAFLIRQKVGLSEVEFWRELFDRGGIFAHPEPWALKVGDDVDATMPSGDRLEGEVLQVHPPTDFVCTARNWNHGIFRIKYETWFGSPEVNLWVSLWGGPSSPTRELEARLREMIASHFR